MRRFATVAAGTMFVVACSDSNPRTADTSAFPNAGAGEKINVIQLDTTSRAAPSPAPAAPTARTEEPSLRINGEGRTQEVPRNSSRDPMPPLTGETSKRGGTMPVAPPLRDSVAGPRMQIDSKGNVTPIKK